MAAFALKQSTYEYKTCISVHLFSRTKFFIWYLVISNKKICLIECLHEQPRLKCPILGHGFVDPADFQLSSTDDFKLLLDVAQEYFLFNLPSISIPFHMRRGMQAVTTVITE